MTTLYEIAQELRHVLIPVNPRTGATAISRADYVEYFAQLEGLESKPFDLFMNEKVLSQEAACVWTTKI